MYQYYTHTNVGDFGAEIDKLILKLPAKASISDVDRSASAYLWQGKIQIRAKCLCFQKCIMKRRSSRRRVPLSQNCLYLG